MNRSRPSKLLATIAILLPLVTTLVQWLLWEYIRPFVWFLFYPTVFFTSRIGGKRAGIASTVVSALLVTYVFIPPQLSYSGKASNNLLSVLVFTLMGVCFSFTHDRLARSDRQRAEAEEEVRQARDELRAAQLDLLEAEKQKSNSELQASEERLRFALETCEIGAWEFDTTGRATFRSPLHHRIFGYHAPPSVWNYQSFIDHVVPDDRPVVEGRIWNSTAAASGWSLECRIRRADGEIRWIWVAGRPRQASAVSSARFAGIVQDITDRKRTEEALRAIEMGRDVALDAAQAGTWEWELPTGRIVWSKQLWGLYGLSEQAEPSYDTWLDTVHPHHRPCVAEAIEGIRRRGGELNIEWRVHTADDSERWLMARGRPLVASDGSVARYLGVVIDITRQKLPEERLKRRNDELERFGRAAEERELTMIRLKRRVNDLCAQLGQDPPYDLAFLAEAGVKPEEQP
ncbi:PAS domain-containing protein [Geomonas sp. Red32]|uniref:PAS domain-containing protein n=1 Tax=Geomonas sp. Red32 TaxID=2912856 RepID=UPI00202CF9DB|nr:PAS domain-containing protein [Geomonas sp. Red32]MCM0084255.1 PAS domain-containing protein [Geomonas sp. Red32]